MTIPCPKCNYPVYAPDTEPLSEDAVLSQAARIHNSRRKLNSGGRNGGRPRGCRKCAKCGKFHKQEEMNKCKA